MNHIEKAKQIARIVVDAYDAAGIDTFVEAHPIQEIVEANQRKEAPEDADE